MHFYCKAAYLDTPAEILFRQNKISAAVQKAEKALETAKDDEKENYQKRFDRFKQKAENQ